MKRTYSKTPQNKEEPQPVISSRVGRLINGGGIKHAAVAAQLVPAPIRSRHNSSQSQVVPSFQVPAPIQKPYVLHITLKRFLMNIGRA